MKYKTLMIGEKVRLSLHSPFRKDCEDEVVFEVAYIGLNWRLDLYYYLKASKGEGYYGATKDSRGYKFKPKQLITKGGGVIEDEWIAAGDTIEVVKIIPQITKEHSISIGSKYIVSSVLSDTLTVWIDKKKRKSFVTTFDCVKLIKQDLNNKYD
ncbi:hypothetical protein AB832_07810 [Flavobacteriaceae bacterium (ex Bugula neritina AB1)]|nr:hypothetical protein AB832_07810 [Flavobacteriaceae bacterium (ex Bugula neritina AB1)]